MIEVAISKGLEVRGRQAFTWSGRPIRIGRDSESEIKISGLGFMRFSAEISVGPNGYVIRETSTTNFLRINQRPLREFGPLRSGDVIDIGSWSLRVTQAMSPVGKLVGGLEVADSSVPQSSLIPPSVSSDQAEAAAQRLTSTVTYLRNALETVQRSWTTMSEEEIRRECWEILGRPDSPLLTQGCAQSEIGSRAISEVVGLGPIEAYLSDPEVSEVMVNGPDTIYIEKNGRLHRTEGVFTDESSLRRVIERIFSPTSRRIDDSSPMADARLQDGSRVNAVLSPLSVRGSSITIRRFTHSALTAGQIMEGRGASEQMLDYLRRSVESRKSIVVSGGTGSGKTTFLRFLAAQIPHDERLITIEDAAELNLDHPNIVSMESRSKNIEGKGEITIRELVRNALRMRPDRILIGEVRGGEALDLLQAMNTGHEGSLTTLHANSPRDAIARLEVMSMMAGYDIPVTALREQIASAVELVVQMSRDRDGRRYVSAISRVDGTDSGRIQLEPLFAWSREQETFEEVGVLSC